MNKHLDLWMLQPYDWREPMLAETEQEAKQYAKQWIIKEYELSDDIHISERYYRHKQKYVFYVDGVENEHNLISVQPISWAQ